MVPQQISGRSKLANAGKTGIPSDPLICGDIQPTATGDRKLDHKNFPSYDSRDRGNIPVYGRLTNLETTGDEGDLIAGSKQ